MARSSVLLAALAMLFLLPAPALRADDAPGTALVLAPAPELPPLASDEDAAAALAAFEEAFKARGLRGDDKISQKDWAMSQLAQVQHPDVVDALFKVTRDREPILRTLAVIYLGEQRALPAYAGEKVVQALRRNDKNDILVMSALQAIGELRYLGAREVIVDLLKHRDYAIKKAAIAAAGATRDLRLMQEVLKVLGIEWTPNQPDGGAGASGNDSSSGGQEEAEEGYSWDGVEVEYDTGASGDSDQQMAEKIGKEKLAANKAAAEAAAGRSSGGGAPSTGAAGGDGGGASGGRGATARTSQELLPAILRTLHQMTGQKFDRPSTVRRWLRANNEAIREAIEVLDQREKDAARDPKRAREAAAAAQDEAQDEGQDAAG